MLLEHLFFCASMAVLLSKRLSLQTIHAIDGMKLLILLLIFVLSGMPSSLCAEEVIVDSLYWQNAEQKMEEEEYKDAARIYSEMIVLGDSLFRVYTGERVEDMRKDYTIDELELQNSAQQKRLLQLSFIIILSLAVFLLGGFFYLKKVGKRLLHSKNELQKAKSMAEESIRNKSLFLSNMSHEIKTPLNALAGFSEVLTTPGIDEATRVQCNDVIQLNSELLLKLINDVVDISCLDVANMKFSITTHEVVALCRNVVKMLDNIKQTSADIRFETELTSLEIETDQGRLQQMLVNLLVNATKFTKEEERDYDVYILDISIPDISGFELIAKIRELNDQARIVVNTMHEEIWMVNRLVQCGVNAVILKSSAHAELVAAIRSVLRGESYTCSRFASILQKLNSSSSSLQPKDAPTRRERDVLEAVAKGMNTHEIAALLKISENTVETFRKRLISKFGAKNAIDMVVKAVSQGWIKLD